MKTIISLLFFLAGFSALNAQISFNPLPTQPPDHIISIVTDDVHHVLYACTYIRVYRSLDNGLSWEKTANPGAIGVNTLFVTAAGQLYAGVDMTSGTISSGLTAYNPNTNTWTAVAGAPVNVTAIVELPNGDLICGTGSTGNFSPNPINYGTGIYRFNGSTWATENAGLPNVPGFNNLPYIKAFALSASGEWYVATYGNGVLRYETGVWQSTGLGGNVSSLLFTNDNQLLAGLDNGIAKMTGINMWATADGLPQKPVRALARGSAGRLYAGLGNYVWMDGDLAGEIFISDDDGLSWQKSDTGLRTSDVLCLKSLGNQLLAGAAGLWRSTDDGLSWSRAPGVFFGGNLVFSVVRNKAGHLFAACDNQPRYAGFGGIFRSTDDGQSWEQIITGIQRHRCNFLFCDSKGQLWAGFTRFVGTASNGSHTGGVLYKSVDNGETWVANTSILTPSLRFSGMKESPTGKLYVINGWGGPSNISASQDYEHWDNTLNGGAGNGGMAFGLAVNAAGDVFIGTETQGIMRSLDDGLAPFETVSPVGGNSGVFVDPHSNFVFGSVPGAGNGIGFWGSVPADNGTNMFQFDQFPAYTYPVSMVFDNRGNLYMTANSGGFSNAGFYTSAAPWHAGSSFTKIMANATVSYYFTGMFIDPCGYIYGAQAGVYKSALPVNTPPAPTLVSPPDGAINLAPTDIPLMWDHPCGPGQFRLQVSTDSLFTAIVADTVVQSVVFTMAPEDGTRYFWRVQALNTAGAGLWSAPFSFTTAISVSGTTETGESSASIFPNPVGGYFTLITKDIKPGSRITLQDALGKQVWEGRLESGEQIIQLKRLPSGVYGLWIEGSLKKRIVIR